MYRSLFLEILTQTIHAFGDPMLITVYGTNFINGPNLEEFLYRVGETKNRADQD